jgi:putative acyl-CoA dehydrogenase
VREAGVTAGSAAALEHGRRAERNEPRLVTHDRFGHRVDRVELDPGWHWLLDGAVERGIHALPWADPRPGAHVARAALELLWTHPNAGVMCPISMTYSAIPALRADAELAAEWEPRLIAGELCGMAMTEKQGGSDVRANTTRAEPAGGGWYELTGHKWFCSYPPCTVFLVLAQAPAGLSCFVLERGPGMEFQRLKDKLGTRSLPSSEVEFRAAPARLLGEEGRGVATIIEMVTHTRLDCVIGSAAGMRRGVSEAIWHARHRSAFGARLVDQPAMVNVLTDLALESEAATVTALRLARAYDEGDHALRRFATAVSKYWICKRATPHAAESLECLGGNGYVEESPMPRLLRDAPLNGIWEGSGNVIALDVLRALAREPAAGEAFMAECALARGADARLDAHLDALRMPGDPWEARRAVEDLALAFQASLLVRHAPGFVADAFCAARLAGPGRAFGTVPAGVDGRAIVDRALPDQRSTE